MPAISKESRKRILSEIRKTNLHKWSDTTLEDIAIKLNPKLRGWINYYGKFGKSALMQVMGKLDNRLQKFLRNKYKIVSVWESVDMLKSIRRDSQL